MPATRTFTPPVAQIPFAFAQLEYVKIDMNAREVTGFVQFLDSQGNALRSDPFRLAFSQLSGPVLNTGAQFVMAILGGIGLAAGTDSVT